MITLCDIRYTNRRFEGAVVLPSHDGPLTYRCRVDGPASLDPIHVKSALLGHARRQRIRTA